jgi:superfamily II DNA or RNA helicase
LALVAVTQVGLFDDPVELDLPQLSYGPISVSAGSIQCALRSKATVTAEPLGEVAISPRLKAPFYRLQNGETVAVTTRKRVERPADIDGVLFQDDDGKLTWQSHRLIDSLNRDAAERGWPAVVADNARGWQRQFVYRAERPNDDGTVDLGKEGLRPPQIGALHAIGAHWSLSEQAATIVMPTGTGKTETMLSTLAAHDLASILVVVPTDALRSQTARKFLTFGLLRKLGALLPEAANPIVGIVRKRPKTVEDLEIFERCNVVIATMAALKKGKSDDDQATDEDLDEDETDEAVTDADDGAPDDIAVEIAKRVDLLVVDEAHHIPAAGWARFREAFRDKPVLQFTATPFRRDGRLVDGQVIYSYPLRKAQEDKYFKPITFEPVYEPTTAKADRAVAELAISRLKRDLDAGLNHLMMARCKTITRAKAVAELYGKLAPELKPVLIHSKMSNTDAIIADLRSGKHRICVCVNMLGEGFDLPELKVAAVHDLHKSLAVLLQFTGRFTRTAGDNIGDATVVANIADPGVSGALERLYSEDADWNQLLSELSSEAAKDHARLVKFLQEAKPIVGNEDDRDAAISRQLLRPTLSTLVFEADKFTPKKFHKGLPSNLIVDRAWLHPTENTLFFVTKTEPYLKWSRTKSVRDQQWALFVLHYDDERKLLYLSSSDKSSEFKLLAKAVGAGDLISGETIFRSLGRIARLLFQNIGLKKHGRRNLSYAMYTGAQVAEALGLYDKNKASKSNLSGIGWEEGKQVTIGCSAKGRIWSREQGSILRLTDWCRHVGDKLRDNSIDMKDLLSNVLIPTEVAVLPDVEVLNIEWPAELLREAEERIGLKQGARDSNSLTFDLGMLGVDRTANAIDFELIEASGGQCAKFRFALGGENGFSVQQTSGDKVMVTVGRLPTDTLEHFFSQWPPLFRFVDLTELDANLHIAPNNPQELKLPEELFEPWEWDGVDFAKESMWKGGVLRPDSIQMHAVKYFKDGAFDVIFDDDASGEAADLVCMKLEDDRIRVVFVHCKFAGGATPGERVKDVVEVSSQAVRSTKWNARFNQLVQHIKKRDEALKTAARPTRFVVGSAAELNQFVKLCRIKPTQSEILIVQPGLSKSKRTPDQTQVLAAAVTYVKETIDVDVSIVCSA